MRGARQRSSLAGAHGGRLRRADRRRRYRPGSDRSQPGEPEAQRQTRARVKVEKDKQFLGLDAFDKVIDAGVDVVLLATPPGFRPQHLAACIDGGRHVFCEKPIATDAPGVRSVLATTEKAAAKNLNLVSGFCWRYNNMIQDTFEQIEERRDRQARGLLRDLLHESREAHAAGQRASRRA